MQEALLWIHVDIANQVAGSRVNASDVGYLAASLHNPSTTRFDLIVRESALNQLIVKILDLSVEIVSRSCR